MKRNLKIIITIILLIGLVIAAFLFNKQEQEKAAEQEKEELHRVYKQASSHMHMELDESKYEETNNPEDIDLTPTDMTFNLLDRWKFISEKYPEIDYPRKAINDGNWIQVRNVLGEQSLKMEDVSIKIAEEFENNSDERINAMAVYDYIYYNKSTADYFDEFLKENNKE